MMQFILWRHAEAIPCADNDLCRTLTPKGHRQAKNAAQIIQTLLPKHAHICVSQATRSQQTAAYLRHPEQLLPELNPNASATQLLPILQQYHDDDSVVWVGHQPWIGDLAGFLLTSAWHQQGIWVKKGAFWHFTLTRQGDAWTAKLRNVVSG